MQWAKTKRRRQNEVVWVPCERVWVWMWAQQSTAAPAVAETAKVYKPKFLSVSVGHSKRLDGFVREHNCTRIHSFMFIVVVRMFVVYRTLCRWLSTTESWMSRGSFQIVKWNEIACTSDTGINLVNENIILVPSKFNVNLSDRYKRTRFSFCAIWKILHTVPELVTLSGVKIAHIPFKSIEPAAIVSIDFFSCVCCALISGHMQCKCYCRRRHRCSARQFERRRFVCTWINFVENFYVLFCMLDETVYCVVVVASTVFGAAAIAGRKGAADR